jgi:dCTP deaminase
MPFWTTEKLLREQKKKQLIDPFKIEFVKQGAYELALGPEAFVTTEPRGTKQRLTLGEQLVIPLTEEVVTIPNTAIGFISVRFTLKRRGLVNVSGFHVDPGFVGRLKFAVYNAGSQKIVVSRGDRVFMIWYCDLTEPTSDLYKGQSSNQDKITSEDVMFLQGEVASPAELKKQIDELRGEFSTWKKIIVSLLTGIMAGLFLLSLRSCFERPAVPANVPAQNNDTNIPKNRSDEKAIDKGSMATPEPSK